MRITFEQLWPLLLILGVVPLVWSRRHSLIEFHRRQLDLMLITRAAGTGRPRTTGSPSFLPPGPGLSRSRTFR